jgi:hypothetical protein
MSNASLARPGTTGTAIVALTRGGGTPVAIKIHTQQVDIRVQNRINEVTGETHVTPNFQHGGMSYVNFRFTGFVRSDEKIGVAELAKIGDTENDGGTTLTFAMHNSRTISGTALFSEVNIAYGKNTPHVQVAISGVFTDTANGVVESEPTPAL